MSCVSYLWTCCLLGEASDLKWRASWKEATWVVNQSLKLVFQNTIAVLPLWVEALMAINLGMVSDYHYLCSCSNRSFVIQQIPGSICSWWWWTAASSASLWPPSPWHPLKSGISFCVSVQPLMKLVRGISSKETQGKISERRDDILSTVREQVLWELSPKFWHLKCRIRKKELSWKYALTTVNIMNHLRWTF